MMSMNGFTLGFFFPKQDFVAPVSKETTPSDKKDSRAQMAAAIASDDCVERPAPLWLYAYRFF